MSKAPPRDVSIATQFEGMFQNRKERIKLRYVQETEEHPKMFQVYLNQAWHEVFCYAVGFEDTGRYEDKLLFTIVSGSDSALQSLKGAIDIGSHGGLKFGYGTKELTGYTFHREQSFYGEKGKYNN